MNRGPAAGRATAGRWAVSGGCSARRELPWARAAIGVGASRRGTAVAPSGTSSGLGAEDATVELGVATAALRDRPAEGEGCGDGGADTAAVAGGGEGIDGSEAGTDWTAALTAATASAPAWLAWDRAASTPPGAEVGTPGTAEIPALPDPYAEGGAISAVASSAKTS